MSLESLKINENILLKNYTTLKIGGPAEWLAEPKSINEVKLLINWVNEKQIPCRVIGAGSNLLINDSGLEGLSLCMKKIHGANINKKSGQINALSGQSLPNLARQAAKAGLHGFEWAIGIPGTIGGAVAMNAGAQGSCISEKLISIEVLPLKGGSAFEIKKKDLDFSYRKSLLQQEDLLLLSACFKLEPGHDHKELIRITAENLNKRKSSQPYHLPSCGSIFRNPEPQKAGEIIDSLGLKGKRIGGAEISNMHANFIVNSYHASSTDIYQLIRFIQNTVKNSRGILLDLEVKQLGF